MNKAATRYARALFSVNANCGDALEDIWALFKENPTLYLALTSPIVPKNEKIRCLERVFETLGEPMLSFIKLCVKNNRTDIIGDIAVEYRTLSDEKAGVVRGTLRCARPMAKEQIDVLRAFLCKKFHKSKALLHVTEEPSLLGGFVLEAEGVMFDKSIAGSLQEMRSSLLSR